MTILQTWECVYSLYKKYKTVINLLLTYSIVQSPSWEANWFAASQEIPHILWNPKVHYRTHKRPPPVPILGQPNPVHIPTSHLLEIDNDNKFIICLYMFRALCAHHQEVKLYYTASGIITTLGVRPVHSPLSTCAPDGHLQRVMIPDSV